MNVIKSQWFENQNFLLDTISFLASRYFFWIMNFHEDIAKVKII